MRLVGMSCGFLVLLALILLPPPKSQILSNREETTHLIHQPKNYFRVILKPSRQLTPKCRKLRRRSRRRVTRIPNHAPRCRLLRRIVISHVIVRIKNGVGAFSYGDVVNGVGIEPVVRFVELGAQAVGEWTHAFEEESYTEEIYLGRFWS